MERDYSMERKKLANCNEKQLAKGMRLANGMKLANGNKLSNGKQEISQ
jgi:hypothetical protein